MFLGTNCLTRHTFLKIYGPCSLTHARSNVMLILYTTTYFLEVGVPTSSNISSGSGSGSNSNITR